MTTASQELHLTQSGVSQHIKSLEDTLGVPLFDRIKQRLIPTSSANLLYTTCASGLQGLEQILSEVKGGDQVLHGTVSIGMPVEFGNNIIMGLLSEFSAKHPLVKFKLKLEFASVMNEQLLKGDLDFAFVDAVKMDRRITTESVYDEIIDLCVMQEALKEKGSARNARGYYESLDYVDYEDGETVLRMWFDHHINNHNLTLNVKATVMDVQGVARLILGGLGAGVLPRYLIEKLQKEGHKIHTFKGCGKPLINTISVAYLKDRTQSPSAAAALDWLRKTLV